MSDRTHPDSGPVTPGEAGFTAADMATASAQGFRDGVASLSANAGEPVAWQYRSLPDVGGVWFECSKERAEQRAAHPDRWEVRPLYAAPPTAQAEGWTKPRRTITYTCPVCAASLEMQE